MSRLRVATGALLLAGGASVVAVATIPDPSSPVVAQARAPAVQVATPAGAGASVPAPPWTSPSTLPASLPAFDWSLPAAPTAPAPAAPNASAAPAAPAVTELPAPPAPSAPAPVLPASEPVALEIPALGIDRPVASVGISPDGTIEVPVPGPAYDLPAWYRYSPTPGERGPAVVVGHVDHSDGTPSVFAGIGGLQPGEEVRIRRADGSTVNFRVTGIAGYPKTAFPTELVYGDLDHAGLRLITCSGGIDPSSGHYRDNTVVFAAAV